jgi:coproporphyrinogen III oxidase
LFFDRSCVFLVSTSSRISSIIPSISLSNRWFFYELERRSGRLRSKLV